MMVMETCYLTEEGNPLAFTREVSIKETGNNLEITGIRVHKYPIDYVANGDQARNDYVIFRYADVLLMKAEAQFRSGNAAGALATVNTIRAKRNASALSSVDLNSILDERGQGTLLGKLEKAGSNPLRKIPTTMAGKTKR